jgi:hypothetical protein
VGQSRVDRDIEPAWAALAVLAGDVGARKKRHEDYQPFVTWPFARSRCF